MATSADGTRGASATMTTGSVVGATTIATARAAGSATLKVTPRRRAGDGKNAGAPTHGAGVAMRTTGGAPAVGGATTMDEVAGSAIRADTPSRRGWEGRR